MFGKRDRDNPLLAVPPPTGVGVFGGNSCNSSVSSASSGHSAFGSSVTTEDVGRSSRTSVISTASSSTAAARRTSMTRWGVAKQTPMHPYLSPFWDCADEGYPQRVGCVSVRTHGGGGESGYTLQQYPGARPTVTQQSRRQTTRPPTHATRPPQIGQLQARRTADAGDF
ncbi:hypothetical protein PYCC9005_004163 [Savitreella phatthalungensis]